MTVSCLQCSTQFVRGRVAHVFCSKSCSNKARKNKLIEPVKVVCGKCGKTFEIKAPRYKRRLRKTKSSIYCSRACKATTAKRVSLTCKTCGEQFELRESVARWRKKAFTKGALYCSNSCAQRGRKKVLRTRKADWSDEQFEWEKKLTEAGLGENVGLNSRHIIYTDKLWEFKPK